ncbi:hypothetical protein [Brevibacillus reuszeri]|nr:hypothetical protein [Brevibacillus reuszeri]
MLFHKILQDEPALKIKKAVFVGIRGLVHINGFKLTGTSAVIAD